MLPAGDARRQAGAPRGSRGHRRDGAGRHVDVGGDVAGRADAGHRSAGRHLDRAGRGRRGTRVTGIYDDARQPTWSPDGKWITYFAYRDGGYDLWAIAPDGTGLHRLTWGPFDDREPAWSHDGTRVAFSSDRGNPLGSDYNIWMLDTRSGDLTQLTKNPAEDFMPSWSPDDREIAFASTRENSQSVWAVSVADLAERKLATVSGARLDAPSWGPGGQVVYHVTAPARAATRWTASASTGTENVFAFRSSWASPTEFVYVSDGRIRRRAIGTPAAADGGVLGHAAGHPASVHAPRARLHLDDAAKGARHRPARHLARWQPDRIRRRRRHLRRAVGRRQAGQPDQRLGARHRSRRGRPTAPVSSTRRTRTAPLLQLWIRDMKSGAGAAGHLADHAAARRLVLARRQEGGVLQRRRHVAGRARCRSWTWPAAR